MLQIHDTAIQEIGREQELLTGKLHVGTNDSNSLYVLPEVVRDYCQLHPGVQIHLYNGHSNDVSRWLSEGIVELGVATLPVQEKSITSEILYPREDLLILPPNHPLSKKDFIEPRDLEEFPFIYLHRGSVSHRRFLDQLSVSSFGPSQLMQAGSLEVIKRFVELGLGISVVPKINCQRELDEGSLVGRRLDWMPEYTVGVIRRASSYLSPAAIAFKELLLERFKENESKPPTSHSGGLTPVL
jgi:DNA-binding transcriptional LysR family regulator